MAGFDLKYFPAQAIRFTVAATQTADFNAANGTVYPIAPAGATLNVTLPAPAASTHIILKDMSNDLGNKTINIVRNGAELIDGVAANIEVESEFGAVHLISDGTDWFII